jgi:hypothetical protein
MMIFDTCSRVRDILFSVNDSSRCVDDGCVDLSRLEDASLFADAVESEYGVVVSDLCLRNVIMRSYDSVSSFVYSFSSYLERRRSFSVI